MDIKAEKKILREKFQKMRRELPDAYRQKAHEDIFTKLVRHQKILEAKLLCMYVSYHEEVDTHRFIEWCVKAGKRVVIPKVMGAELELKEISLLTECVPGFKGILEPPPSAKTVDKHEIDVFVVLGLAFDNEGYRLGYGKGFTDRLLLGTRGYYVGLAYREQLVKRLPHDAYDVPVAEVIING